MTGKLPWWGRMRGTPELTSCMHALRVMQRHLDGELDAATSGRVDRHLELCRRCGLEADAYLSIKQALTSGDHGPALAAAVGRLEAFAHELSGSGAENG